MQGNTQLVRSGVRPAPLAGRRAFGVVDELNCYFDAPAEPNNVHVEVWLPGRLDADRLRGAVTAMLAGQPRAGARRAAGSRWRLGYAWEFPPQADVDPVSTARWETEVDLGRIRERFLVAAPPVDRSPPFRLLLARGPGRDSLILNAHHAAFDGRSCLRLLRLIADQYRAGPPEAGEARWSDGGGARWSDGGAFWSRPSGQLSRRTGRSGGKPDSAARRFRAPVRRFRAPVRRTVRIASRHAGAGRPGYGLVLLGWAGVPSTPQAGVTVNDLLIATLIRAIQRWNQAARRPPGRVRISMPVDARPPGHGDELGNLSRLCTVTADPLGTALTMVVADQTRRAKKQPGPPVNPALAAVAKAPVPTWGKRHIVRLALRCLGRLECDTSLLSNLGNVTDPPRFGALVPERMWFSTSAHMPRGLSVGAITVGGRLQLCFRYRRALLDEAAAHDFAAEYAAALDELADSG